MALPDLGLMRLAGCIAAVVAMLSLPCTAGASGAAAGALPAEHAPIDWALFRSLWLPDVPRATADEPFIGRYSEARALEFLDGVALKWARQNHCGTCHTTVPYMMARPLVSDAAGQAAVTEVRKAAAGFAANEAAQKTGIATIIAGATVAAFTISDATSAEPLPADTRALLDFLWDTQEASGEWLVRADGLLPFLERDPRYLALLVALAAGYAPPGYLDEPRARAGLDRLRGYLRKHPPENLHEKAVLLWASKRTPGLLSPRRQADYARALLARQNADGGWALPALGRWPRHDGARNDPRVSDGYATALVTMVLCDRGPAAASPALQRGTDWLRSHQRESGRWYTRSLFSDGFQNYLSTMGTAYAVMALHRCGTSAP